MRVTLDQSWACAWCLDQAEASHVRLRVQLFQQDRERTPDTLSPAACIPETGTDALDQALDLDLERGKQTRFTVLEELVERATRDPGLLTDTTDGGCFETALTHYFDYREHQTTALHLDYVRTLTTGVLGRSGAVSRSVRLRRLADELR
jgi:hypothetical protein